MQTAQTAVRLSACTGNRRDGRRTVLVTKCFDSFTADFFLQTLSGNILREAERLMSLSVSARPCQSHRVLPDLSSVCFTSSVLNLGQTFRDFLTSSFHSFLTRRRRSLPLQFAASARRAADFYFYSVYLQEVQT